MARGTSKKKASAILCADIHLMSRVPACRREDEFHDAMWRKLDFIRELQRKHDCPVLCAGDVFDRWLEVPWLISGAIQRIHGWVCVAGQHDLPQHNPELYHKSTLATLEAAGCVHVIQNGKDQFNTYNHAAEFTVVGFPWGSELVGWERRRGDYGPMVALVHHLVYPGKPPFPGAEKSGSTVPALMKKLKGFDLIVTGDNHEPFEAEKEGCLLVNPGSMMRTSAKQANYRPSVTLWYGGTTTERVFLPCDEDVVHTEHVQTEAVRDERIQAFVEHLKGEVDLDLSFADNVRRELDACDASPPVRQIVEEVLDGTR